MKKIAVLAASILLCGAAAANAEHRLLVTDIVDPGHVEAQATWEFTHFNAGVKGNVSEAFFSAGVGLMKDLELNVTQPYVIKESFPEEEPVKGWGDLVIGAKYRLVKDKPVSLTAGLNVRLDTGSDAATSDSVAWNPFIAASADMGHGTKTYAVYSPVFDTEGTDSHKILAGFETELSHRVTLDARIQTTFFVNAGDFKSYGADLGLYVETLKNVYLLPTVGITHFVGHHFDANALTTGIGAYFLF